MKKEDLFAALADIDPASVEQARACRGRRTPGWMRWTAAAACLALLIVAVLGVLTARNGGLGGTATSYPAGVTVLEAVRPEPVARRLSAAQFLESGEKREWWTGYRELTAAAAGLSSGLDGYSYALLSRVLTGEDENRVCSPLNTYFALAALTEATGGNTRRQLLDLLGAEDRETLRATVSALWQSNSVDTPVLKSLPAASLWLDSRAEYNTDTLKRLAEVYHASVFSGLMGSKEMDRAVQIWTDEHTGGLLREYTQEMSGEYAQGMTMLPDTVMELLSTIYFKALWLNDFREEATTRETFHGTAGDSTVDMMHGMDMLSVHYGEGFTAVGLPLGYSGFMYFLLPEAGTDLNALLSDPALLQVLRAEGADEWAVRTVHLSIPRFKVSGKTDLRKTLAALGVTDALDPDLADFSPLTAESGAPIFLSGAEHTAMLEIDEHGVTGAAYTALRAASAGVLPEEKLYFTLDRPFLFLVTGGDGSILFAGAVRNLP